MDWQSKKYYVCSACIARTEEVFNIYMCNKVHCGVLSVKLHRL